jgi:hypothetical protein
MTTMFGGTKSQNAWSWRLVKEVIVFKALSDLKWSKAIKSHLNDIGYLGRPRDRAFGSPTILLADGNANTDWIAGFHQIEIEAMPVL